MDLVPWQGWLEAGFNSGGTFPLWHDVLWSFLGSLDSKESACNVEAAGLVPGSGRSPGEGYGTPLQYSCLDNSRDRGAWWATVHGVAKSWTRMSD